MVDSVAQHCRHASLDEEVFRYPVISESATQLDPRKRKTFVNDYFRAAYPDAYSDLMLSRC